MGLHVLALWFACMSVSRTLCISAWRCDDWYSGQAVQVSLRLHNVSTCIQCSTTYIIYAVSFVLSVTETDPTGTDPKGTDPTGSDPAGSDPAGSDPAGSDPAGSDPAGSDPTGSG